MLDIIDLECKYKDDVIFSGLTIKNLDRGMNFIKGRSGCGKTSLIKLLIGMIIIEKGKIIFDDEEVTDFVKFREKYIAYVFQDNSLVDYYTVKENLMMVNRDISKIKEVLNKVHLLNKLDSYPNTLSGGERQRINIARALLKDSFINIFDEPTASVNMSLKHEIMMLIKDNFKDKINIIISHNNELINMYADRVIDIEKNEDKIINNKGYSYPLEVKYNPPVFKLILSSYKHKNKLPFLVVSLVLLIVITSLSLFNGIDEYIAYNLHKKIDYNYFYLSEYDNKILNHLKDNYQISIVNNYQEMLNNKYRDKILIDNLKVFDFFEIKVYDGKEKILINKYFFDFKNSKKINFIGKEYETTVIDDGTLYTSPTIYFSYDFLYSLFGDYKSKSTCFKTSDYNHVYTYLSKNYKNKYSLDIKENELYFDNSTLMINESLGPFLSSIHSIILLLSYSIIIMSISFINTLINYNIKERQKELLIYRYFGLKNINLIVIYEALILVFFSFISSLILFLIFAPIFNHFTPFLFGEYFALIHFNFFAFFVSLLLSLFLVLLAYYGNRFKKNK